MKKLFYCAAALATLLFAGSCQRENLEPVDMGTTVSFEVEVPDLAQTKSGANVKDDGTNINDLVYAVYKTNETTEEKALQTLTSDMRIYQRNQGEGETSFNAGVTKVQLELLNDQNYVVLFWAQVDDAWVKPDTDAQKFDLLKITYPTSMNANDEKLEAFSGFAFIAADDVDGGLKREVTLTRPFAQINVGTLEPTAFDEFSFVNSNIVVRNAGDNFNVATQTATTTRGEDKDLTFVATEIPGGKLSVDGKVTEYTYAGMNYVFANDTKANVVLTYNITTNHGIVTNTIPAVPVAQNYRTNIIGNLLTSNATYEVKLDNRWNTPDETIEVWNGSELNEPKKSATDENVYEIEFPSEIAWLAAAVNGTLPVDTKAAGTKDADSFAGKTFVLTSDIDLNNCDWTPIGNANTPFKGTFDGQNHTVKNLVVNGGRESDKGLFGVTMDGEIKNLVVENAKVSGYLNVGVVAGTPYTSKYTNITVKGHVEVNGMAYVGGVGGKNAYADWTNITVDVDETSYVNANSVENGTAYRSYVGGVVGFNGEGGHSFKNITSNIDVKGSTCDVGGLFGIAHYGNQFENCSCSGDVKIYAAEEAAEAEEIGGIAGVWMDSDEANVTFANVSFTGNVTTNIEREIVWYNNLFGKPYNNNGKGKLIVDGMEMVANGVGVKEGDYYVTSAQGLVWVEAQADNFFAGKTIKLANDIDMDGVTIANPIKFWNGRTTFDGQNYTISNLTMSTTSTEKKPFGLFGGTADIKNVKFDNANISGYSYVAVVAGNLYGNIENCHVSNSSVTCTYWMAGALSGQYNNGNVTDCTVTNTTVTGPAAVGALVGVINETMGERKIEDCTIKNCTIAQKGSFGGDYDGMFAAAVGLINIDKSKVYFTNCNIENTTVKDTESTDLFGRNDCDETIVYVNGYEFIAPGLGYDKTSKTYAVSSAEGLVAMSNTTIKGGESVILTADIDLTGVEFNGLNAFNPESNNTFDGKGYTVSNWTYTGGAADMAFIKNWVGPIKNVTIEGASLKTNGRSAVLAAKVYANIDNCHVVRSSIEDSYWACGLIAGLYNSGNITNCSVDGCYVKSNGGTGGIVGVINESAGERKVENCLVKNTTVNNLGSYGESYSGGLVCGIFNAGSATYHFNNCTLENNTKEGNYVGDLFYSAEDETVYVDGVQQ